MQGARGQDGTAVDQIEIVSLRPLPLPAFCTPRPSGPLYDEAPVDNLF